MLNNNENAVASSSTASSSTASSSTASSSTASSSTASSSTASSSAASSATALSTNGRTAALLDVDRTLIFDGDTYNYTLIDELIAAGIKDVYLFTKMTLKPSAIEERQKLIDLLREKGLNVHGLICGSDIIWNKDTGLLKQAYDETLQVRVEDSIAILDQEKYKPLVDISDAEAGKAFEQASWLKSVKGDEDKQNPLWTTTNGQHYQNYSAMILYYIKSKENSEHKEAIAKTEKSHVYQSFIANKPQWVNRIIFIDDAQDNLDAVQGMHDKLQPEGVELITILNKGPEGCQMSAEYYRERLPAVDPALVDNAEDNAAAEAGIEENRLSFEDFLAHHNIETDEDKQGAKDVIMQMAMLKIIVEDEKNGRIPQNDKVDYKKEILKVKREILFSFARASKDVRFGNLLNNLKGMGSHFVSENVLLINSQTGLVQKYRGLKNDEQNKALSADSVKAIRDSRKEMEKDSLMLRELEKLEFVREEHAKPRQQAAASSRQGMFGQKPVQEHEEPSTDSACTIM